MDEEHFDTEHRHADADVTDTIEFAHGDDADTAIEVRLLAARVQAARHCGA